MSEKKTFKIGDSVAYATHGPGGKIVDIFERVDGGTKTYLYRVHYEESGLKLLVPATNPSLRHLSSQQDLDDISSSILKARAKASRVQWNKRCQDYTAKINSGNPTSIAEVLRDLYKNPDKGEKQGSEQPLFEEALKRLAREFSEVQKITFDEAQVKIKGILSSRTK